MGEWDRAIEECRAGVEMSPDPVAASLAGGFLGATYFEKGDMAAAIPQLQRAVELCTRVGVRQTAAWYTALLAEAKAAHGERGDGRAVALGALEALTALGYAYGAATAQRSLGRIALVEGDVEGAARWLERALGSYRAIGARYDVARTELDVARLARAQARNDVAARSLREALTAFEALRIPVYAERCRKLPIELGVAPF
jgi:tetratricopeptide (TPR) repeat protein